MKIKKIEYKYIAFLVIFILAGCDNFTELNKPNDEILVSKLDKNRIGQVFAKSQFPYNDYLLGYQTAENLYSDLYSQYFATSVEYFKTDEFQYQASWVNSSWQAFYSGGAAQLRQVLDFTSDHNMEAENAVAKIWKVVLYQKVTDYWGPIIFSQFGNGKKKVSYDAQKDIYMEFFKILDEAVGVLKQNRDKSVFVSNDLLYNNDGNADNWLTFANSLRLRLALRLSYVVPEKAKKEAEKAINAPGGVIDNNEDNAELYTAFPNTIYPLARVGQWKEYRMSAALVSALKGYKDPRLSAYMAEAVDGGGYHGLRNGVPSTYRGGTEMDKYSFTAKKYLPENEGGTSPRWPVIDAAEVYFLRAEGALRGWDMKGTVEQLYNKGIRVSIEDKTSATSSEIDKYIISTNTPIALNDKWDSPPVFNIPVKFQSGANFETKLEQVISQKWLALYPDGWEAWAERRRTDYPHLYPLIQSANPDIPADAIVRRMKFVTSEYDNNNEEVDKAIKLLRKPTDTQMVRLWWDAKGLNK